MLRLLKNFFHVTTGLPLLGLVGLIALVTGNHGSGAAAALGTVAGWAALLVVVALAVVSGLVSLVGLPMWQVFLGLYLATSFLFAGWITVNEKV